MSAIILNTFATGADKALQLGNEEWGRLLQIGSTWNRIRIGIMCNLDPDGTNNISAGSLRIAATNGVDKHVGSGTGQLAYGVIFGSSSNPPVLTGGTFTYNAGGGDPYFSYPGYSAFKNVNGGALVFGSSNATARAMFASTGAVKRRSVLFVDLEKSGTSLLVRGNSLLVTSLGNADYTFSHFDQALADAGTGNINVNGVTHTGISLATFTGHDTDVGTYGPLNSIHVGWSKGTPTFLNVYVVKVYRFS